ncbi:nitrogen fixation regulatory protein [mine drainage metagenome]|uniref:Nitrogen fixation regulatory protein n=1 Tax=mine drainage metagenome TaxID=410659 RepID=A0A1J5SW18_9ZZZZ
MFKRSIAQLRKHNRENQQSVRRLLIVLIGSVFFIEAFLMAVLALLPPMSETLAALLDAAMLSLLLFPIFYYLIFRPLVRNIAEREQVEADLRIAAVAFEIKDPTLITDARANIVRANQKLLDKLGYSMEEIVGRNPRIFKSGLHDRKYYEQLWKQLLQTGYWSGEIRIRTKEGRILHPFWLTITAVKNEQQEITHYIGIYNF